MQRQVQSIVNRMSGSKLFRDSFWAVFGNGLGYAVLLLAGIVIARMLGRDVYGEYGLVKTSMLYVAGFATMGLGVTSTKYVAESVGRDPSGVRAVARDAIAVTVGFSSVLALLLIAFAAPLARYLDAPGLVNAFRALGVLVVLKAVSTTQNGVLAGLGEFKTIARNNVISGVTMLIICVPLTLWLSLAGALAALMFSQIMVVALNALSLKRLMAPFPSPRKDESRKKELFLFSIPLALQESSYTLCAWGGTLMLTKMSSLGELGLYTAASQWNAVITFIPGLLSNVVLSHLSASVDDRSVHKRTIKTMLSVNLVCTLIPSLVVYILAGWITSFYGDTFTGLKPVLRIFTVAAIFTCCSNVFYSEFISRGYNWLVLSFRLVQDIVIIGLAYILLRYFGGVDGAICYASAFALGTFVYIVLLAVFYTIRLRR